jgi:hypothetical protein
VFDIAPLLQQSEDQFAYRVFSRALDRSADGNRFLDTLFFTLIAAQAAIFAIILDKITEYPALDWSLMLGGLVLALGGAGLSLFVGDGPDPDEFAAEFPEDPQGSRIAHIEDYIVKANRNGRLGTVKVVVLILAAALTIVPLVIAAAGRATGV